MNFLTVFVRPPGDLVYFVLVVVVLMACLLMTVGQAVRRNTQSASRLAAGLTFSFGAWMLILLAVVFALLRGEEFHLNSFRRSNVLFKCGSSLRWDWPSVPRPIPRWKSTFDAARSELR